MTQLSAHLAIGLLASTLLSACTVSAERDREDKPSRDASAAPDAPRAERKASKRDVESADAPARAGRGDDPAAASTRPAPAAQQGGAFTFREGKLEIEDRTGDAKEDTWRYFKLWGEITNGTADSLYDISGDIHYLDASGNELGIDSITTAVKKEHGDQSPGEPVGSEVKFVQPGQTVPLHHIRSLNKIAGQPRAYRITWRTPEPVASAPKGGLQASSDIVGELPDENRPGSSALERRVIKGTLSNSGNLACANAGVVLGLYDAGGKLADLQEADARTALIPPGGSSEVTISVLSGFDDSWKGKAPVKAWLRCSEPQ